MRNYEIAICKQAAPYFNEMLKSKGYKKRGLYITEDNQYTKIVIPFVENWFDIEGELFDWKIKSEIPEVKNSGFWGQYSSCV